MAKKVNETVDNETGEITEMTETTGTSISERAVQTIVGQQFNLGSKNFRVKAQVTHSVLRQKDGETVFVTILDAIYQGEELKSARAGQPKMAPARLVKIIDLNTTKEGLLIVNTVLEGELVKSYPLDKDGKPTYIGKSLAITMNAAREGTRYKTFDIFEIELEA
jgi:hypothetical protein